METSFSFMAFAKGVETTDEKVSYKKYYGVAPVRIKAINPTAKELSAIYDREFEEPVYISEEDNNGEKVKSVRIEFVLQTAEDICGVDSLFRMSLFLKDKPQIKKDNTKVKVIDKYGRTAWVTKEEFQNKAIPVYKNGPARISNDYRACLVGEDVLIDFIKTFLGIPSVDKYVNGTWFTVDKPEDSEVGFDDIKKLFTGDVAQVKEAISFQPNNYIKVMIGVRTTDDNKQYQTVSTDMFLRGGSNNYTKLIARIEERKANGGYASTEFFNGDIKEYENTPKPTEFKQEDPLAAPFDNDPWKM